MENRSVVPYSFDSDVIPAQSTQPLPGQYQIVHFTVTDPGNTQAFVNKITKWFAPFDEVLLVQHGVTASGLGFVVLEWDGCAANPLFLSILETDEMIDDYSVYTRDDDEED